jgi:hypothetical protein
MGQITRREFLRRGCETAAGLLAFSLISGISVDANAEVLRPNTRPVSPTLLSPTPKESLISFINYKKHTFPALQSRVEQKGNPPEFYEQYAKSISELKIQYDQGLRAGIVYPETLYPLRAIHDSENRGGYHNAERLADKLDEWKMDTVKTYAPSKDHLNTLAARGKRVVVRADMLHNRFNNQTKDGLRELVQNTMNAYPKGELLFQLFNETNLPGETGGVFIPPEEHIKSDFAPASEYVLDLTHGRAKIITTPLAPEAWVNALFTSHYRTQMFEALYAQKGAIWIEKYLIQGENPYALSLGEDPFWRIEEAAMEVHSSTGLFLPQIACEWGVNQHGPNRVYGHEKVASELERFYKSRIPNHLKPILKDSKLMLWLFTTSPQSPYDFTLNALVSEDGDYPESEMLRKLAV